MRRFDICRELNAEFAAALLRLQADDDLQSRYDELAKRNTEGGLAPEERQELTLIVRGNWMLSVLKAEAHVFLQSNREA